MLFIKVILDATEIRSLADDEQLLNAFMVRKSGVRVSGVRVMLSVKLSVNLELQLGSQVALVRLS